MRPRGPSRCQAVVSELAENMTLSYCFIAMVRLQWVVHGIRTMLNSRLRSEFTGAETYCPKVEILQSLSKSRIRLRLFSQLGNKRIKREIFGDSGGGYMGSRPQVGFHLDSTIIMALVFVSICFYVLRTWVRPASLQHLPG